MGKRPVMERAMKLKPHKSRFLYDLLQRGDYIYGTRPVEVLILKSIASNYCLSMSNMCRSNQPIKQSIKNSYMKILDL